MYIFPSLALCLTLLFAGHLDSSLLVPGDVDAHHPAVPEPIAQPGHLRRPLGLLPDAAEEAADLRAVPLLALLQGGADGVDDVGRSQLAGLATQEEVRGVSEKEQNCGLSTEQRGTTALTALADLTSV